MGGGEGRRLNSLARAPGRDSSSRAACFAGVRASCASHVSSVSRIVSRAAVELGDLPIDAVEDRLRRLAHLVARLAAGLAHAQEAADLRQREAESHRVAHERDPVDDGLEYSR